MLWEFYVCVMLCTLMFAYLTVGSEGFLWLAVILLVLCAALPNLNSFVSALLPFLWYGFTYSLISLGWVEYIMVVYHYMDFPTLYGQVFVMWFGALLVFYFVYSAGYCTLYFLFLLESLFSQSEYFSELFSYYEIAGEDFCSTWKVHFCLTVLFFGMWLWYYHCPTALFFGMWLWSYFN